MVAASIEDYLLWRREWDSNPRTSSSPITRFRVERVTAASLPLRPGHAGKVVYTISGQKAMPADRDTRASASKRP